MSVPKESVYIRPEALDKIVKCDETFLVANTSQNIHRMNATSGDKFPCITSDP